MGGPRYSTKVRIGNWNEDESRFGLAAADYEARRSRGELLHLRKAREKAFQTQPVPHTYSADGVLRYGDNVQLGIVLGGGARYLLASNIFNTVAPGHVRVTAGDAAASLGAAQARNVWVLSRPAARRAGGSVPSRSGDDAGDADTSPVCYGDRIMLACNASLTVDPSTRTAGIPFVLYSQRMNNVTGSGRKGLQEVTMTTRSDADAEWIVSSADVTAFVEGSPVKAGDPIVLLHAMSNEALAADTSHVQPTDFGSELEVHCLSYRRPARASMSHTGDLPSTAPQAQNVWSFVTAATAAAGEDTRGFRPLTVSALLDRARAALAAACGPHGMRSLSLAFSSLDERGTGSIPKDRAKWAIFEHGVKLSDEEFARLLAPFEQSASLVAAGDLLAVLRGDNYSASRAEVVRAAYAALSSGGLVEPTVAAVKKRYDAKFDPRVKHEQSMTAVEAAGEFARQWPRHVAPTAVVTPDDFESYHIDVSACIDDDAAFVEHVANVWHLDGRGSWQGKKGKKVLVTLHKGSSIETVIPGAEDVPDDDFSTLSSMLQAQGFGGIARIKVLGLVDAV